MAQESARGRHADRDLPGSSSPAREEQACLRLISVSLAAARCSRQPMPQNSRMQRPGTGTTLPIETRSYHSSRTRGLAMSPLRPRAWSVLCHNRAARPPR